MNRLCQIRQKMFTKSVNPKIFGGKILIYEDPKISSTITMRQQEIPRCVCEEGGGGVWGVGEGGVLLP